MRSSPVNYKTPRGLFHAFVRCLGEPASVKRAYWLRNALWHAEHNMKDLVLVAQLRRLQDEAGPKTVDDLIQMY